MLSFSLALLVAALAPSEQPAVVALFGSQVLDGTGGPPIADGVVLVEGNKIVAVGPRTRVSIPAGARRLDARGGTILPGLTDLHTHAAYFVPNPRDFEDDSLNALRASAILRQALDSGITLVRDAGARHYVSIGLKHAIAKGYIEGPRFVVCGNIVGITGAHGSENELMLPPKVLLESDSPYEWRKHIRKNFKMGADFVKVTSPFTLEEIQIAAEEAHNFGARIAVDAAFQVYKGMMMVEHAVTAGADTIEHLYPMKNEA
jgi:imidazolonepropionase-like amidohydrolase